MMTRVHGGVIVRRRRRALVRTTTVPSAGFAGALLKACDVPKSQPSSVDEYTASQPEPARELLERVRGVIRKTVPDAEELISYNMPAYKLNGADLLQFAGWKQHYSLYFASESVVAAFADDLAPYKISKGTISFPLSQPVPEELIERIVRFRAKESILS